MKLSANVTLQTHVTELGPQYSARVQLVDGENVMLEAYEAFWSEKERDAFVDRKIAAFQANAEALQSGTGPVTTKVPLK